MKKYRLDQRIVVPIMSIATFFIVITDGTITTVALPSIASQFHLTTARIDAVAVVYPVCVGMVIPVSGWLSDRLGDKRVLLTATALFTIASTLCGMANSLRTLVLFRGLQGLSGGLLLPVVGATVLRTFTSRERVRIARVMALPQQVAPAAAPMLGGLLVDGLSWRWVFYVNLPLGFLAFVFGLLFLDNRRQPAPGRFDLPGFLLAASAMGTLMYGVSEGAQRGWSTPSIVVSLGAGAVLLAATIVVELRVREPVLRLSLFGNRLFRHTNLVNLIGLLPFMGAVYLAPLLLQQAQGATALQSGTSTFPEAIGIALTVQLASRLYARVGPRRLIGTGLLWVAAVLLLMTTWDTEATLWTFRLCMFLLGMGMGAVIMPIAVASYSTVSTADMAQASTLSSVLGQVAMALAPALVATLLVAGASGSGGAAEPEVSAYHLVYRVLALIAVASALFALTMRDEAARRAAADGPARDSPAPGVSSTPVPD